MRTARRTKVALPAIGGVLFGGAAALLATVAGESVPHALGNQRMNDLSTERIKAALQEALAISRAESRQLLEEVGQRFAEEVRVGTLLLGVERGFARQFLSDPRSEDIGRRFGVSLPLPRMILNTAMMLEPLCAIGLIVLAFSLLGWWGFIVLFLLPLLIWGSWKSAHIPRYRGRLPKALTIAFLSYGMYAVGERLATPHLLAALLGFVLFSAVVVKYEYPTWRIRRLVTKRPELCRTLIDADVVGLRRPTS